MTSCPDAVACSSGSAAKRPVRIIRAAEREEEVLKLRAAREGPEAARRPGRRAFMKADMANWIRGFGLIKVNREELRKIGGIWGLAKGRFGTRLGRLGLPRC